jgi:hypothetical protein
MNKKMPRLPQQQKHQQLKRVTALKHLQQKIPHLGHLQLKPSVSLTCQAQASLDALTTLTLAGTAQQTLRTPSTQQPQSAQGALMQTWLQGSGFR